MPHLRRPLIHAVAVLAVVGILTACSTGSRAKVPVAESSTAAGEAVASDADLDAANQKALDVYVEAERATIPTLLKMYPGMYSTVDITGSLEEQDGTKGLPAGKYSVVFFDYTYAQAMDWTATSEGLDAQRPAIDTLCDTTLFPAMKKVGVTGSMSVVYTYSDNQNEFEPMWSHTCTDQ
ncbi:hypothetical protein [Orlajensenia leifsoniae]|uniref:Lipoprotein n=1 Tax=Orlajensenia leifsoniae TaxID=2561933 RepID=A0A4Y9R641_9MICO|nr:hypothetical protein [Leifsonia flava]TFV98925.1 hypothetical protein E4M00_05330 [Leifsonia flava]